MGCLNDEGAATVAFCRTAATAGVNDGGDDAAIGGDISDGESFHEQGHRLFGVPSQSHTLPPTAAAAAAAAACSAVLNRGTAARHLNKGRREVTYGKSTGGGF
eukprot:evm.model.NODE_39824_length_45102_cov_22.830252.11